jgi:hypothetical protein
LFSIRKQGNRVSLKKANGLTSYQTKQTKVGRTNAGNLKGRKGARRYGVSEAFLHFMSLAYTFGIVLKFPPETLIVSNMLTNRLWRWRFAGRTMYASANDT